MNEIGARGRLNGAPAVVLSVELGD